jgi:hypothetical protein
MLGMRGPEPTRFETPGPEVGNGEFGLAGHAADPPRDESRVLLMPANHRNILAINDPGYF